MEEGNWFQLPLLLFTSFIVFLVCSFFFFFLEKHVSPKTLPPSPPSLPLIGHLHLLKEPFPRTLHELTSKHGRVLFLRFGCRKILVVSSASAVEECFTKHDAVFADRPRILASQILNCGNYTLGFAPYGAYWRNLRKFMTIEVFIPKSVASFSDIRQAEAYLLVKQLFNESGGKTYRVRMRSKLVDLAFNIIMRILVGKRYSGGDVDSEQGRQIKEVIKELGRLQGSASHLGDYIPILQKMDFQGVKKRMLESRKAMDTFLRQLLDMQRSDSSRKTCLINRMLSKQQNEPDFYSDKTIKAVLQTMLVAGTDTTSTTAEWALFLLLNHPEALARAQTEIDSAFGHSRLVDDSSVQNLPYLQSIITETLRLFPPVPLLLPHESTEDSTVCGFHVPRRTTLLVNLRSIHRDPDLWADPERFMPERFQHGSVVGGSEGYKWMAFGVGRRACPGATFGRKVLGLALAAMLQCFEWRRIGAEAIDIVEGTGLTMPPATPVEALCKPRDAMVKLLASLEVSEGGVGDA